MEQIKRCYNNDLVVISQCSFHHSTILGMPGDSAVDRPHEETEAIPVRCASLKTLHWQEMITKLFVKWQLVER